MSRFALVALTFGLAGCGNACQNICTPMADYARSCGLTVTSGDIAQCEQANSGDVSQQQADVCNEYSDPVKMRAWWSCSDVKANMTGAAQ